MNYLRKGFAYDIICGYAQKVSGYKNTTIYTISKISGVNRTMIQHMKVGKRMPANIADVMPSPKP